MFNFLKEKIKKVVNVVSEKIKREEDEAPLLEEDGLTKTKKQKEKPEESKKKSEEAEKSFLGKIKEKATTKKLSDEKFEELFEDLEKVLLENNVALEVVDKIKEDLKMDMVDKPLSRKNIDDQIKKSLRSSILSLFEKPFDLLSKIKNKPYVICFVGINGSGKTTTLAKVANFLQKNGKTCVFSASDTFRAASIEQLQFHADKLDIKLIKHNYGADPAAVAFDTIKYAKNHNIDVVLIDTSGRLHSNENLMAELQKITRVSNPDLILFVGEAITGNDCIEQAKTFNEQIGLDGIILAKQDVDEKGGTAISISYVTKLPILFIGCGQYLDDLEKFDVNKLLKQLGL